MILNKLQKELKIRLFFSDYDSPNMLASMAKRWSKIILKRGKMCVTLEAQQDNNFEAKNSDLQPLKMASKDLKAMVEVLG